jgi:hypothetical protein
MIKKVSIGLTGLLGLNALFVSFTLSDRLNAHSSIQAQLLVANLFLVSIGLICAAVWMAVDL